MNIIKLSAIDSTNDYLKINFSELIKKEIHIAYTFNQTNGKGREEIHGLVNQKRI